MEKILTEDRVYFNETAMLSETTHVSFHRRTPTQMALIHKALVGENGHQVVDHVTNPDGSHVIAHLNRLSKLRLTKIEPFNRKSCLSKITDRPAKTEELSTWIKKAEQCSN